MATKWKQGTARTGTAIIGRRSRPGQVVAAQQWGKAGIDLERCGIQSLAGRRRCPALRRVVEPRVADKYRDAVSVQARRVERWIDNAKVEMLSQKCLLISNSKLNVVDALHVREIGADPGIGQRPILRDRFLLKVRRTKIREWVLAGIVIESVPPHPAAKTEDCCRIDHSRPGRRNVEGLDQRALISGADDVAVRMQTPIRNHHTIPRRGKLTVNTVGRLEPGTGKSED